MKVILFLGIIGSLVLLIVVGEFFFFNLVVCLECLRKGMMGMRDWYIEV